MKDLGSNKSIIYNQYLANNAIEGTTVTLKMIK